MRQPLAVELFIGEWLPVPFMLTTECGRGGRHFHLLRTSYGQELGFV